VGSYIVGDSNSVFIELKDFENLSEPGFRVKDVISKLKILDSGETIIIGVGVNDAATIKDLQTKNEIRPKLEEFKKDCYNLLRLAKNKFGSVIVLGLISSTEEKVMFGNAEIQYLNKTIQDFNEAIKNLCNDSGVGFVDTLPYFLGKEDELLVDHIHPNAKGKEIIKNIEIVISSLSRDL